MRDIEYILKEVEKLRKYATPGVWRSTWDDQDLSTPNQLEEWPQIVNEDDEDVIGLSYYDGLFAGCTKSNTEYIVALHNSFEKMAATIREQEERLNKES